jgi:uncharacterized membrane protein
MDTYEFLLFGHLLAVTAWVGTDLALQIFYLRARTGGPERVMAFAGDVEWIGLRLLNPAALLVVIFGVLLVLDQDAYGFDQFWITAGLGLFLLSAITGAAFLGPETGRIKALMANQGAESPDAQRRLARVLLISRIELLLLVLVVLDMVVKPGL